MSEPLPDWPDQPDPPPDIGVDELTAYWNTRGVKEDVVRCFADPYDPITPKQVADIFAPVWKDLINKLKIQAGPAIACDHFGSGARWCSSVAWGKLELNPPAFYYIAYNDANQDEHEVCGCMWRGPDRGLLVAFFEPQPTVVTFPFAQEVLKPITLLDSEIVTATDIRY